MVQGKFYELYELDAEIGHKEMDWKLTYSGVGKCRQVSSVMIALLQVLKSAGSWYDFQANTQTLLTVEKSLSNALTGYFFMYTGWSPREWDR